MIFLTTAINTDADHRILFADVGLDVDIGGAAFIGVDNNLVGKPHDGAVVFANGCVVFILFLRWTAVRTIKFANNVFNVVKEVVFTTGAVEVL